MGCGRNCGRYGKSVIRSISYSWCLLSGQQGVNWAYCLPRSRKTVSTCRPTGDQTTCFVLGSETASHFTMNFFETIGPLSKNFLKFPLSDMRQQRAPTASSSDNCCVRYTLKIQKASDLSSDSSSHTVLVNGTAHSTRSRKLILALAQLQ